MPRADVGADVVQTGVAVFFRDPHRGQPGFNRAPKIVRARWVGAPSFHRGAIAADFVGQSRHRRSQCVPIDWHAAPARGGEQNLVLVSGQFGRAAHRLDRQCGQGDEVITLVFDPTRRINQFACVRSFNW